MMVEPWWGRGGVWWVGGLGRPARGGERGRVTDRTGTRVPGVEVGAGRGAGAPDLAITVAGPETEAGAAPHYQLVFHCSQAPLFSCMLLQSSQGNIEPALVNGKMSLGTSKAKSGLLEDACHMKKRKGKGDVFLGYSLSMICLHHATTAMRRKQLA